MIDYILDVFHGIVSTLAAFALFTFMVSWGTIIVLFVLRALGFI